MYGEGKGMRELDYVDAETSVPLLDAVVKETLRLHPPLHSIMRYVNTRPRRPAHPRCPLPLPQRYGLRHSQGSLHHGSPRRIQVDPQPLVLPRHVQSTSLARPSSSALEDSGEQQEDFGFGMISTGANSPYLPFGAGRHRCIGEQFAYLQIGVIIATFVRMFKWELEKGFAEPDYQSMVVLPKKGLWD